MAVETRTPTSLVEHEANTLPPLENGDRLTRAEFKRRYESMPNTKKAELIDGVVYMPSPVRILHAEPHADVMTWLGNYRVATPGVRLGDNPTVRLDIDNEPQPDAALRIESDKGGKAHASPDGYIEGPPELVVEVALSSAAYDLHDKMRVYRRNGVQEYLVWQVYDKRVDWWELRDEVYAALPVNEHGVVHSRVFPGLWLHAGALLKGDMAQVLATLQQGLQSDEHAAFLKKIAGES